MMKDEVQQVYLRGHRGSVCRTMWVALRAEVNWHKSLKKVLTVMKRKKRVNR